MHQASKIVFIELQTPDRMVKGILNQNFNSLGSVVDDNADGADDSSNSSFESEKIIQRKDATQDQKHRHIFQNEFPSDDSVETEKDTPTESLLKFYTQNKKKITMTMAQQKQSEFKKNPVRMTKGFSLVTKLDTRRKCAIICKTFIMKGNCAVGHCTIVGKRTGKPKYVHAKVQCLTLLETSLMAEFLAKKWTEQFMIKLSTDVSKKMNQLTEKTKMKPNDI
jgi:hypothetical protein